MELMQEETIRVCRVCGEEKPLDEFRIRGDSGKRRTECRSCLSKYLKRYRSENKQRISELNKDGPKHIKRSCQIIALIGNEIIEKNVVPTIRNLVRI